MRLLHFDDSRLVLTDFTGKTLPPYAILSHRWSSNDSEVFFEDLVHNNYESKTGYRKIEFCAKQVARDDLKYFWIDTCCIDKWNRHERSKAVNSMFRWYQSAAKCYVFMADVSVSTTNNARQESKQKASLRALKRVFRKFPPGMFGSHRTNILQPNAWEASFRGSEWFTRGWTLQELIAPASVEFFSSEGQRLGDKESLKQLIHEITSIPIAALQAYSLPDFTPSDRVA